MFTKVRAQGLQRVSTKNCTNVPFKIVQSFSRSRNTECRTFGSFTKIPHSNQNYLWKKSFDYIALHKRSLSTLQPKMQLDEQAKEKIELMRSNFAADNVGEALEQL